MKGPNLQWDLYDIPEKFSSVSLAGSSWEVENINSAQGTMGNLQDLFHVSDLFLGWEKQDTPTWSIPQIPDSIWSIDFLHLCSP